MKKRKQTLLWERALEYLLNMVEQLATGHATLGGNYPHPREQIKSLFRLALFQSRKEMIEEIENMPIETVGNSAKTVEQILATLRGKSKLGNKHK